MDSDNPTGDPDYQQGRLEAYLSGFVDGEGAFSVGVQRRPDLPFGFQLVPEFRVSQDVERASVLEILRETLGCGRIVRNDRNSQRDHTYVLVVRRRTDLLYRVLPFFQRNPILSEKRSSSETFAHIVTAMAAGEHLERDGFERLVRLAFTMNGGGRYRRWKIEDVIGFENPQRLHAEHP
ncbi:MAG: LAGLIDADG family homing endonuclease, partial [Actinobacteria bacterium]|nr:LAGLIDADG family homing endonuclease [Actinomycetota bacterium]